MNDIIIIDDAIPKVRQLEIEEMCTNPMFKWSFLPNSVKEDDINQYRARVTEHSLNVPQLGATLYSQNEAIPEFVTMVPILSALPYTIGFLTKIKITMTLPAAGATDLTYGMPHVDFPNTPENMTAIYYVNDTDGDTVIFNEEYGHQGQLTEKKRISPKQGRLVVFNGRLMHAGNYPTKNNPRIITNINFVPYGDHK
jgi:hypothetical protein